jgi:M6 family metalloprotease-like protein
MKKVAVLLAILMTMSAIDMYAIRPPRKGPIPKELIPIMREIEKGYSEGYWPAHMRERYDKRQALGKFFEATVAKIDTVNMPVLCARYSNMTPRFTAAELQQHLYDGPNPWGTITDFYWQNSYGQMFMTGKALDWVTCPRDFNYYVKDGTSGSKSNVGLVYGAKDLLIDCIVLGDSAIDFSPYVKYTDAEGAHVPLLAMIHTGADAAGGADNIWSHKSSIRNRLNTRKNSGTETIIKDLTRILSNGHYRTNDFYNGLPVIIDGDYSTMPEVEGSQNNGSEMIEVGVFVHEYGHAIGIPDLYDRDNTSEGLGNWCVMAAGSWGSDGSHPASPSSFSAWCKEKMGWVSSTVISTFMQQKSIRYVQKYPEIYKLLVRNTSGGQYFLIENRQKVDGDRYLPSAGLCIYHVDPSVTTQNDNENHYLVDMEEADGLNGLHRANNRGDAGDPYPGSSNNRRFDMFTNPNSNDYLNASSYVSVTQISTSDTTMLADIDVGTRPYISMNSIALRESGTNNNNGRIEANEQATISLNISNVVPAALSSATITLTSSEPSITIDPTPRTISVAGLESKVIDLTNIFQLKSDAVPKTTTINLSVDIPPYTVTTPFEIVLGYPRTVIVDLDSIANPGIVRFYRNVLDAKNELYESASALASTLGNTYLDKRSIVIWCTGSKRTGTIPDSLAVPLKNFLTAGGKLFLTGQNIAEDLTAKNSPLCDSILRARWNRNVAFGRTVIGIASDRFGAALPKLSAGGGDGASNQISPDDLLIDTLQVHPSFRWNSETGGFAGLWYTAANGSKVVFWGFGFESINDSAAGMNTRAQAMGAVMDWFNGVVSVPEINVSRYVPIVYSLEQNYPNPFNPSTQIRYGLPKAGYVTLRIYNAIGQEVALLVNGEQHEGNHTISFDAKKLTSGIYYYRLTAGDYVSTRKMVMIR